MDDRFYRTTDQLLTAESDRLSRLLGQSLEWLLHPIELGFSNGVIALYNALDENGVQDFRHIAPMFRTKAIEHK